jgi:hypothetical protein
MALKLGGSALVPVSTVDNPALNLVVGKFVRFTIKGGSSNSAVIVSDQSPPLRKAGTMLLPKLFGAAKTAEVFTPAKPKGLVVPPKLKTTAEPPTSKATIEPTKPKVLSTNSQSSYTDFVFPGAKPIAAIKPAGMVEPKAPLKIVLPVRQSENASASAANVEAEEEFTGEVVMFHSRKGFGQICCDTPGKWFEKDIIAQSINTGSDVSGNQFDLQVGDGGAGIFDACVGGSAPGLDSMFAGSKESWGHQYGGVDNRSQCSQLPLHPAVDEPMKQAGDDLVALCEYSFDHGVRGENGHNPSILSLGRVECPEELIFMTQMQRNDDPSGFVPSSPMHAEHACQADIPNMPLDWCLTRMMDCRKPSAAWRSSVEPELMVPGRKLVQTCTADGYTRYDNQCGCFDCDC